MPRHFTRWPVVEGFATRQSYLPGEVVDVHCSSRAARITAEVVRVGQGRDVVWWETGIRASEQPIEDDAWQVGCDWPVTFSVPVDASWPSGFYEIALTADGDDTEQATSEAFFVVRAAPGSEAAAILVLSTNTYNAYNQWGGKCLYSGATKASFARPLERGYLRRPAAPYETDYDGRVASIEADADEEHLRFQRYLAETDYPLWCSSSGWHSWERRFVQWAERSGIALDYAVNSDLDSSGDALQGHRLMLSVGHDEYWTWGMRDQVDAFVENGGSWAIFSGNTCFWQVRYEGDGRTMIAYKAQAEQLDPVVGTERHRRMTAMWSTPSIGRPEALSTGLSFTRGGYARVGQATPRSSGGYDIHRPDHPVFTGTGLRYGDVLGSADRIVGYEVDGCDLTMAGGIPVPTHLDGTPPGLEVLATAPAHLLSITATTCEAPKALWASVDPPGDLELVSTVLFGDDSPENLARITNGHAVMGIHSKGRGRVFHAGTTDWAFGLDRDPLVQRVTLNVVRELGGAGDR